MDTTKELMENIDVILSESPLNEESDTTISLQTTQAVIDMIDKEETSISHQSQQIRNTSVNISDVVQDDNSCQVKNKASLESDVNKVSLESDVNKASLESDVNKSSLKSDVNTTSLESDVNKSSLESDVNTTSLESVDAAICTPDLKLITTKHTSAIKNVINPANPHNEIIGDNKNDPTASEHEIGEEDLAGSKLVHNSTDGVCTQSDPHTELSMISESLDDLDKGSSNIKNNLEACEPPLKRQRVMDGNEIESSQTEEASSEIYLSGEPAYTAIPVCQPEEGNRPSHLRQESPSTLSSYRLQGVPRQVSGAWTCFYSQSCNNYTRGCKWAPDGTCLMTNTNDNCIRVFNTPNTLYDVGGPDMDQTTEMVPVLRMKEVDTIYDYCWFSKMRSSDPDSACLAVTTKDSPVHLYDAFTGDLRCSYRAFNHLDELAPAYSLSFDLTGSKLYCGFNKMIRVFDVSRPGRQCTNRPTYAKEGQGGIISCIAHSPTETGLYAAGSYSRTIALYKDPSGELICMFQGQVGGVTHIMFSPDGSKLYSGGRKDDEILCWDLRNPGQLLYMMERKVATNQRIYFDITKDGRYVVSGCHDGQVMVWDTQEPPVMAVGVSDPCLQPSMSYQAHFDTVNGISVHPDLPVIASSSGQRHLPQIEDSSDDSDMEQDRIDNSLKLWWIT